MVAQRSCSVRLARRLLLVGLALILAGCGGGGGPVIGSPSPTDPTSSGNTGPTSAPTVTLSPTTAGDPGVAIQVGGPSIGSPGPGPIALSFGEVAIGATSAAQVAELQSLAGHAATVVGMRIEGDASFRLEDDRCSGTVLPPGGSGGCRFAVVFSPQRDGPAQAAIIVAMSHTCTAATYVPCSWDPQMWEGMATNFTREVLADGRVIFRWSSSGYRISGTGTTAGPSTS